MLVVVSRVPSRPVFTNPPLTVTLPLYEQVSSFCIAAAASRQRPPSLALDEPKMSSVFELEISSDSMSQEEQQEAQVHYQ